MNKTLKKILTNFSYTLTSNLVTLIISTLMILILPKLIGVRDYGYWQLYLFYISYLGFFNIGWVEGIYLRYAGIEYNRLNKRLFASQFFFFVIYIAVVVSFLLLFSRLFIENDDKKYIIIMVSLSLLVTVPRGFLLYVLQTSNRIKSFSMIILVDRLLYLFLISMLLLLGVEEYKPLIFADFITKVITLSYLIYLCREIVFLKIDSIKDVCQEILKNISIGIKLMFANIANMLVIGIVRFGIEKNWDIATFGKVSLVLSISNLMMTFINALGIVLFPMLRRIENGNYPRIYSVLRDFLIPTLLASLLLLFPLKYILSMWLPIYSESLKYLSLLLPLIVFEGKMILLINTYLKTLREETLMLKINILTVILSIIMTFISTMLMNNLDIAVLSIVILLAIRSSVSEIILGKKLGINITKDLILEIFMVLVFMVATWVNISSVFSLTIYLVIFIFYIYLKKDNLDASIRIFKKAFIEKKNL